MTETLQLGDGFALPLDAVTQTFAILAKRGAGKTNAGVVMAEEMLTAGIPWVALDPVGSWWGIRADGDGAPGLPVVVLGGEHGDLPLEPTAGTVLADTVIDQRGAMPWVVFDMSDLSDGDVRRFATAFLRQLYRRNREPLHLFFEEAEVILPQQVRAHDAPMVGAVQKLIKLGRGRGLGCTLITQRSASVNKDGLTQVETLIAMRTTGPQDRAAILSWVKDHEAGAEAVASLPDLPAGEAYVFSPGWIGELTRVTFRRRRTFDSGAPTPPRPNWRSWRSHGCSSGSPTWRRSWPAPSGCATGSPPSTAPCRWRRRPSRSRPPTPWRPSADWTTSRISVGVARWSAPMAEDEGGTLFLDQLLGTAPMTEERGFRGPGEYSMCPICGHGFLRASMVVHPDTTVDPVTHQFRPGHGYERAAAAHEELLREHLAGHPIEDILRAINVLQKEARAGRLLRAKVQAALE